MRAVKVLIVEDEFLIAEDLKTTLEELGYEVLGPALSCSSALEVLWSNKPDLALIDTQLGSETCQVVVEECRLQSIPMVICSGHFQSELPDYCKDLPLLGKPYHRTTVMAAMRASAPIEGQVP